MTDEQLREQVVPTEAATTQGKVLLKIVQWGQLIPVPFLAGIFVLMLKCVWLLSAQYEQFDNRINNERTERIIDIKTVESEIKTSAEHTEDHINTVAALQTQRMDAVSEKIIDLKASNSDIQTTLKEILKASATTVQRR